MVMSTVIISFVILSLCFIGFGVGVLFCGKAAEKTACGSVPKIEPDKCPSQQAGLCPFEDKDGYVDIATKSRLSYPKH